ncbi:hypothetical protein Avbf_04578 [Armadillidium vulgare]|nr:hypothetical protein Avbf_04578 [Armadillidium vulgare]
MYLEIFKQLTTQLPYQLIQYSPMEIIGIMMFDEEKEQSSCFYTFDRPFLALDYESELSKYQDDQYTQGCRW